MAAITEENVDVPIPVVVKSGQLISKTSGQIVTVASGSKVLVGITHNAGTTIAEVDSGTKALNVIAVAHHKVHAGQAYIASWHDTDADQTSGAVLSVVFPTSGTYHMNFTVTANAGGLVELWENAARSGGTTVFARNADRTSTNSSIVLFYHTPQSYVSGTGNLLWNGLIGADNNKTRVGGESKNGFEWIFQSGAVQIIYRPDADNKVATITAEYYEVS